MNEQKTKGRKQPPLDVSTAIYGKVPAQSLEMEKGILGAIMLERSAIDVAGEVLKAESFYSGAHQVIYKAMQRLNEKGSPIDLLTVVNELISVNELNNVGGPYYITDLQKGVVSTANIEEHSRIVQQKFMQREMGRIGGDMHAKSYDETTDVFELIDEADKAITELTTGNMRKPYAHISTGVVKAITRIEELRKTGSTITGLNTGFHDINRITHGWQNQDLIIMAARPAVGKTALALNLAMSIAKKGNSVGFISLEMSTGQITERILSAETEILLEKIKTGNLEDKDINFLYTTSEKLFSTLPFYIDDSAYLTISDLRIKVRTMKRKHDIKILFIDYLQLMAGDKKSGNREQEISNISRGLKVLAKELDIPIIALSQLSREVEKRSGGNKMPQLSDLRESGAIEQDADMVVFIYRPEYYDVTANEMGESTSGETHIKFAKHRNGTLDTVKLKAELHIQKFRDWDSVAVTTQQLGKGNWRPVGSITEKEDGLF